MCPLSARMAEQGGGAQAGREGEGEKVSGVGKEEGEQVGWGRKEGGMRGEWGRGEREEEISGGGQGEEGLARRGRCRSGTAKGH